MSATLPPTNAATAIAASTSPSTLKANLETAARNGATDIPAVLQTVATLDPAYASFITGKSALGSKTLISGTVTHMLAWGVGYFGLGWSAGDTELIAGLVSYGLMALFHTISDTPVRSLLPKSAVSP